MTPPRWHPAGWGLGTRFVVVFLAMLLVLQAVVYAVVSGSVERNARASVATELQVGEQVLRSLLRQRASRLVGTLAVLGRDRGIVEAYGDLGKEGGMATMESALDNHARRARASFAALLDNTHAITLATVPVDAELRTIAATVAQQWPAPTGALPADEQLPIVTAVLQGEPFLFLLGRLHAPRDTGWLLMAFPLDERVVREMRDVTALDVALMVRPPAGGPWRATASLLPAEVAGGLGVESAAMQGTSTATMAGTEFGWRAVTLGPTVRAVLLRSVDAAAEPYRALQWPLLQITLVGLLAFAIASAVTARRITHPVRRLVGAAQRLGSGDLATPVRGTGRADEIGELAQAFEGMRHNLADSKARLERQAYEDELTKLPNRVRFSETLRDAIRRGNVESDRLAVLILDLDRFKHVNDVLGYKGGDTLLEGVARRLEQAVKGTDTLARLSGDEFALLLRGCGPDEALGVAHRIAALLETPLKIDDQTIDLPASVGIACWPLHAADAGTVMTRAELAMFHAKARKSGPMLYDPSTDTSSTQTLSLRSDLKRAVEQNELRLFLQPKIGIADGRLIGAEALVRWQHPQRGMVPPMQFIPFAEQTGFIRQLTLWVFEDAARQWRRLADETGQDLRVSINLSARDLLDVDLPDKLGSLLARHDAPAGAFCLEITESAIMDDPGRAEATLQRLSERGFKMSIDDFGTGYSSLAYLKKLPVDELKIDKSFVLGMVDDDGDAKIVRSTIDLAHNLGLSVVAEGVENAAIFNALRRLGCDEAQGYHLSKPMRADAFAAWAQRWTDRSATGWSGLELA